MLASMAGPCGCLVRSSHAECTNTLIVIPAGGSYGYSFLADILPTCWAM